MLTAAVVGCGGIGAAHMRALAGLDGVELRYVVDLTEALAEQRAAEFGITPLTTPDALPDDLDFVTVATPPHAHYPVVRDLLERGFDVFCEKPMTLNVASSEALRDQARALGRHLGVGFKMRYEPWFAQARAVIGAVGPLRHVVTTKHQARHDKAWLAGTGAMQELSSHDFDLVHWIAGTRPERMLAARLEHHYGWAAEDGFSLFVEYAGGLTGALNGLYTDRITWTGRDQTMRFHGRDGYLQIDRGERVVLHTDTVQEWRFEAAPNGFACELGDFAAAIAGGPVRYPDADAAVAATWVVEHAYRLAGEPVPEQPGYAPAETRETR